MIFSENRYPPRIKCGAGFFGIMHEPEGWPSGLRRTLGKRVYGKPYRGFESHSLRHRTRAEDRCRLKTKSFDLNFIGACIMSTQRKHASTRRCVEQFLLFLF